MHKHAAFGEDGMEEKRVSVLIEMIVVGSVGRRLHGFSASLF